MGVPLNYRNKPVDNCRVIRDGKKGWRAITPAGETKCDTQEEGKEVLKNYRDNIVLWGGFVFARPIEIDRINRYTGEVKCR